MKSVTVTVPDGKDAKWVNGILTLVDEAPAKDNRPVTERIKTFEDALNALGGNHPLVQQFKECFENYLDGAENSAVCDLIAYLKLRIITAALNEGWTPKFTKDEWRYYPWYDLYTKEEWDELDEDTKRKRGVYFGGNAYYGAFGGFVYAYSYHAPSRTNADIGSRLCFKTSDLAIYAGKQFAALWLDFCYLPNALSNNQE